MTQLETKAESQRDHLGSIPGFTDYEEEEHYGFSLWKSTVEAVFRKHGFTPFIPRPFEFASHLVEKGGVGKQIYGVSRLQDKSLTDLGIPFDHTVPLALFVAPRLTRLVFPFKRYDTTNSFRGEHPQVGRFRGFVQADVDIIDRELDVMADFECIHAITQALEALPIGTFILSLNHIVVAKALIASFGISREIEPDVLRLVDKLDKLAAPEVVKEILLLDATLSTNHVERMIDVLQFQGDPDDFHPPIAMDSTVETALAEMKSLYTMLIDSGFPKDRIRFTPGMVRGLDYYTGIVFETFLLGKERFGSIASGGRYNDLISHFAKDNSQVEGVGGSIGLTRLFDVLHRNGDLALERKTTADLLIAYRTMEFRHHAAKAACLFRQADVNVDVYTSTQIKISKQLQYANKKGIPAALMIMDENCFVYRDLTSGAQQEFPTLEQAFDFWRAHSVGSETRKDNS